MIKAEFRVIIRDKKEVKQFRNVDQPFESPEEKEKQWQDVSDEKKKTYRRPKRCKDTPDMFEEDLK